MGWLVGGATLFSFTVPIYGWNLISLGFLQDMHNLHQSYSLKLQKFSIGLSLLMKLPFISEFFYKLMACFSELILNMHMHPSP